MRKFYVLFLFCIWQCTSIDVSVSECNVTSEQDFIESALALRSTLYPSTVKSSVTDAYEIEYYIEAQDTLGTIIDISNNGGFILLSYGENKPLIIAEQGNFRESLENPLVSMLVEETIDRDNTVPLDPTEPVFMETVTTFVSDTLKHPLIAARWHQGAPFNLYALNAVDKCAGCVPIAIAQVMSYYKYPEILQLTYPEATENEINLDWDSMIDHNIYHNEDCISCIQCAQLLREIGYKCNSTYNDMSTSTATNLSQIQKFGYTGNEYSDFYFQGIINSLYANRPCIIGAHGNNVGHAWVIDGYYQTTENETTYTVTGNIKRIYRTKVTTSTYLHFNYGAQIGSTLYTLADQTILAKDGTIMGGDSVLHTVTMFDGAFTDVRRLITNIKPVNY